MINLWTLVRDLSYIRAMCRRGSSGQRSGQTPADDDPGLFRGVVSQSRAIIIRQPQSRRNRFFWRKSPVGTYRADTRLSWQLHGYGSWTTLPVLAQARQLTIFSVPPLVAHLFQRHAFAPSSANRCFFHLPGTRAG